MDRILSATNAHRDILLRIGTLVLIHAQIEPSKWINSASVAISLPAPPAMLMVAWNAMMATASLLTRRKQPKFRTIGPNN